MDTKELAQEALGKELLEATLKWPDDRLIMHILGAAKGAIEADKQTRPMPERTPRVRLAQMRAFVAAQAASGAREFAGEMVRLELPDQQRLQIEDLCRRLDEAKATREAELESLKSGSPDRASAAPVASRG
jgi:hypothetical protein